MIQICSKRVWLYLCIQIGTYIFGMLEIWLTSFALKWPFKAKSIRMTIYSISIMFYSPNWDLLNSYYDSGMPYPERINSTQDSSVFSGIDKPYLMTQGFLKILIRINLWLKRKPIRFQSVQIHAQIWWVDSISRQNTKEDDVMELAWYRIAEIPHSLANARDNSAKLVATAMFVDLKVSAVVVRFAPPIPYL